MFIDHVIIEVKAGRGGDGCVSFRREKFVPRGGPDGGDGGKGGDVVIEASSRVSTLIDLHYRQIYWAEKGEHGKGKSKRGRNGADEVVLVPPGTMVKDTGSGAILCELINPGDRFSIALGGGGGLGNERFKTPRNQAPRKFTRGKSGEAKKLELTLKLIADVGLVGEPNAGKSTLLSKLSSAHPKIASYPFTTTSPVLGIVKLAEFESFVLVDIPGLIDGAHMGKGMGRDFLRHIERCRILVFLVDVASADPARSYASLRGELLRYDPDLLKKPSFLALTKCDLLPQGDLPSPLLKLHPKTYPISAVAGYGLRKLLNALRRELELSHHGGGA